MCRFLALILLSATAVALVSVLPAAAQDQPKDEHPAAQHARLTWEEHFTQANKAQDGHLTLDGVVLNNADREIAYMSANGIPGVFSVTNNLRTEK